MEQANKPSGLFFVALGLLLHSIAKEKQGKGQISKLSLTEHMIG